MRTGAAEPSPQLRGRVTLESLALRLQARDELDMERRKLDDAREASAKEERARMIKLTETHPERIQRLENNWTSLFGDQGIFKVLTEKVEAHDRKLDRATWLVAVGLGVVLAAEFFLKR